MTDAELIARLRSDHPDHLTSAAADRIEALIAERDAAEAKMANAVEALRSTLNFIENTEGEMGVILGCGDKARETLAEIKGETHE